MAPEKSFQPPVLRPIPKEKKEKEEDPIVTSLTRDQEALIRKSLIRLLILQAAEKNHKKVLTLPHK